MLVSDICIALGLLSMACAAVMGAREIALFLQSAFNALVVASQPPPKTGTGELSRKRRTVVKPPNPAPLSPANLSGAGTLFVLGALLVLLGLALRAFFAIWGPSVPGSGGFSPSFPTVAALVALTLIGLTWVVSKFFPGGLNKNLERVVAFLTLISALIAGLSFSLDFYKFILEGESEPVGNIELITAIVPKTDHVTFSQLPSLPPFVSAEVQLTPDLQDAICLLRQTARQPDSSVVVVVGRHDQDELSSSVRQRHFSNAGLALQRARAVHAALMSSGGPCAAAPLENVISLHSGPNHIGQKVVARDLAEDRQVQVFYLRRLP